MPLSQHNHAHHADRTLLECVAQSFLRVNPLTHDDDIHKLIDWFWRKDLLKNSMLHMRNGRDKACDGSALWKEGLGRQKQRDDPRNDPARSDDFKKT